MGLRDVFARLRGSSRLRLGKSYYSAFDPEQHALPATAADELLRGSETDLGKLVFGHRGRVLNKWTHYPDIYDANFSRFRNSDVRMLEIGVFRGGSLELWRDYFGPQATIFGIDINPDCAGYADPPNQVRIGSQADPAFLQGVVREMGGVDIVLDDGSHIADHQSTSFRTLWPLLADGGLYVIEDLHTAYWPGDFGGGYRRRGTGIELIKDMIDDMHAWYHAHGSRAVAPDSVLAVHVYDSIAIVEKGKKGRPESIMLG